MSEPANAVPDTAPVCYRHANRETWIRCQRCDRPICPDCMVPAAVGFQCPSCVKEGSKETRTGRLPYGGERSANPALTTQILIGMNVLVWLAVLATTTLVEWLSLHPLGLCALGDTDRYLVGVGESTCGTVSNGNWIPGVADGAFWQIITSVFTHQEFLHLGMNMLLLYFLGPQLETILGRTRFVALYLIAGVAGSAAVMLLEDPQSSTLGASGAIYGLLAAFLVVAYKVGNDLRSVLGMIAIYVALSFLNIGQSVSWQGHLGGAIGGALVAVVLLYSPKANRSKYQLAGCGLVLAVALILIALRAAALA